MDCPTRLKCSHRFTMCLILPNETLQMLVVLSDGETTDTNLHESVIKTAKDKDIKIFSVGLGSSSSSYFNLYLKPLAERTNGKFYLASDSNKLTEVYNKINKQIDITIDSDKDGLPDYYEDNLKNFNGKIIRSNKNIADTDGDGLKDGEEVKVKYEYSKDKKKVRVKGYMLSNPREKDSDGDGDMDKDDPHPMRYLINDRFIDNLGELEEIAKKYPNGDIFKYPSGKDKWYVFMFLRQFNPMYREKKWDGVGGEIDYKFVTDVARKYEKIYHYFVYKKNIYANEKFENIDLYHMAATMNGLVYGTDGYDTKAFESETMPTYKAFLASEVFEEVINDQCGWAGDIHTLMNNTMEVIRKEQKLKGNTNFSNYIPTYNEFYHTFSRLLGDKNYSFSSDDIFADIDAYNIAKELENKDIKSAFTSYYSKGYKKRFTNFLENSNENKLNKRVYVYTKETYFGVKWPLIKYKFNDDHSMAARDVFVKFIITQRGKE